MDICIIYKNYYIPDNYKPIQNICNICWQSVDRYVEYILWIQQNIQHMMFV